MSPDTEQVPAVTDEGAPAGGGKVAQRRLVAVSGLTAHPGNVRDDLALSGEFCASVASEGVRVPLLITTGPDGTLIVIEGHRRLAAAVSAGLAEVPCDLDPGRAGDEAGQYLDMAIANGDGYRVNYTAAEQAAALFAAHEAGATRTRIRKATGTNAARVKTALAAGSLPADLRAAATRARPDTTLDDLAILAEFAGEQDATARLLRSLGSGYPLEHTAERIRQERAEAAEHDRQVAALQEQGVTVTDQFPDGAAYLTDRLHDGDENDGAAQPAHAGEPGTGTETGSLAA